MLFLDEEHIRIETHNFSSDSEATKMIDGLFLTQSTKSETAIFSVKIQGYTDFVFLNTQAESIEIRIINDAGEELYHDIKILKAVAAESCEELLGAEPVWIDVAYFKLCEKVMGTATITITPREGEVKIGKFSYGTPKSIGAVGMDMEYNYEDYMKIKEDQSDFESIDRFEKLSGTVWVNTHYKKFARATLQKVMKKKLVWIDPFIDETFIYGVLESYKIKTREEAGKVNLLTEINMSIRGIV